MNNQNYDYSNLDSNLLNIPRDQNQLPLAFEGNNLPSLHYGSHRYMSADNIFSNNHNPHSVLKDFHPDMASSHCQVASNGISASIPKETGSTCSLVDMNMEKINPLPYSLGHQTTGMPSHGNQDFCSKFSSPTIMNDPAQSYAGSSPAVQREPFVNNVSQSEEYSHQYGSRAIVSHGNGFYDSSLTSNAGAHVNGQPSLPIISEFSTEHINCNQISSTYAEVNVTSDQTICNSQTVAIQSSFSENLIPRPNEFGNVNMEAYTALNVQNTNITSGQEAQSHLELNVDRTFDPSRQMKNAVPVSLNERLSQVYNECPQSYQSINQSSVEETCSATVEQTHTAGINSSVCLPENGLTVSDAKSESHCSMLSSSYQSPVDVTQNVFSAQEKRPLSLPRQELTPNVDTPTLDCCMEGNREESEKVLTENNFCDSVPTISEVGTDIVSQEQVLVTRGTTADETPGSTNTPNVCNRTTADEIPSSTNSPNVCLEKKSSEVMEESNANHIENVDTKPLSPMITVLNDDILEDICSLPDEGGKLQQNGAEEPEADSNNFVRCTRAKTGALPNKSRRFVDESSCDSVDDEDHWEYQEGAELAPSKADPSVTVPDKVLQVTMEELNYYNQQFPDGVDAVLRMQLDCTSCGRHIGAAPNKVQLRNRHKFLRVLTCNRCQGFYGIGKFPRDSDGSEFYCRWCGQGGQVICCSSCPNVFCESCIKRNFGSSELSLISNSSDWACYLCNDFKLWRHRAVCWALLSYILQKKKEALHSSDVRKLMELDQDFSRCCDTVAKKKRRRVSSKKGQSAVASAIPPPPSHEDVSYDNAHFGHFLLDNDSLQSYEEDATEEDDFIDPSQFVQPVLKEVSTPTKTQVSSATHQQHQSHALRSRSSITTSQSVGVQPSTSRPAAVASSPRIVIRQRNLMQPGLIPFNKQPNSIGASSQVTSRYPAPNSHSGSPKPLLRNPANVLNHVEGVRSMEQMQALNIVPWFRDGLDSIRAVGFALTKRIRELEARFHSLKNKHDVEKVIKLGKKLERLSSKTESRFKQINSSMKVGSKQWYLQNVGGNYDQDHPFSRYHDNVSDWDDDLELTRPLEKVLIPVNPGALQQSPVKRQILHNSIQPPPLVRSAVPVPPMVSLHRMPLQRVPPARLPPQRFPPHAAPPIHSRANPAVRGQGNQQFQMRTVFSNNRLSVQPVRFSGPKSRAASYSTFSNSVQPIFLNRMNVEKVNTLLNQRNGTHNISVTISSPTKRKRLESDCSDDSDIVVCPTIPELLARYRIKPCRVIVEKNDEFIVSFLENQERTRKQNIGYHGDPEFPSGNPSGDCGPHFVPEIVSVAGSDISALNPGYSCPVAPEETCTTLEEEMLNVSDSILSCPEGIADSREMDTVLNEDNDCEIEQSMNTDENVAVAAADDDVEIINDIS